MEIEDEDEKLKKKMGKWKKSDNKGKKKEIENEDGKEIKHTWRCGIFRQEGGLTTGEF